jgi:hypothetical protein
MPSFAPWMLWTSSVPIRGRTGGAPSRKCENRSRHGAASLHLQAGAGTIIISMRARGRCVERTTCITGATEYTGRIDGLHHPRSRAGQGRLSSSPPGHRVRLRIVLLEACPAFTRVTACTLALSPTRDTHSEGFSYFVTSIPAPAASGWSRCRVGLAPTGKRRLSTAHASWGDAAAWRSAEVGAPEAERCREKVEYGTYYSTSNPIAT